MHDAYIGRRFRQTKITRKASDAAANLQLYQVVRFFHPRSSCTRTHVSVDVQRITINASCMTISGGRTKQLDIFCCVTGFTSDFLSFIVVELIRFFHRAFQIYYEGQTHNKTMKQYTKPQKVISRQLNRTTKRQNTYKHKLT